MRLWMAITLLSASLLAQTSPAKDRPAGSSPAYVPNQSQLQCAGFLTHKSISRADKVVGSKESPHETQFSARSTIFLRGPGIEAGQRYSILRQVSDPNQEEQFPEQRRKLHELGALYSEIGWVTVHSVIDGTAVASFDFACDTAVAGDIAVPYEAKPELKLRSYDPAIDSFRPANHGVKGEILGSKDFDEVLGTGQIVYTSFGASKGAKPGEYLIMTRSYNPDKLSRVDHASTLLPKVESTATLAPPAGDVTAVNPARVSSDVGQYFPQRVLGEGVVLNADKDSSTVLITRAFSDMQLGDEIQSEAGIVPGEGEAESTPACQPASLTHKLLHPWQMVQGHGCKPTTAQGTSAKKASGANPS